MADRGRFRSSLRWRHQGHHSECPCSGPRIPRVEAGQNFFGYSQPLLWIEIGSRYISDVIIIDGIHDCIIRMEIVVPQSFEKRPPTEGDVLPLDEKGFAFDVAVMAG